MLQRIISFIGLSLILLGCGNASSTNEPDGTSSAGRAMVSTNQRIYLPSDAMVVMVHNALSTAIYAMDTQSSCSILSLQYQVNGAWYPSQVAQCPQKRRTRLVKIDAGATYTATITAGYPGWKQSTFPLGSYRLVLIYTTLPTIVPSPENGV